MTYRRIACCASVAFLLVAPAAAGAATKKPTVAKELSRLAATGAIPAAERNERLSAFNAVKRSVKRLPKRSTRRNELAGAVANVEGIAARRALTGPRLVPLWLTLERNRAYWSANASGPSTRRISFPGSQLVWQWFPGQGLQFHPLANFAKLNQLWATRSDDMGVLLDELLALRVPRAGGVAWEYYFAFGGGNPPWVSALAQGAALQSIARVALRTDREAEVLPIAEHALGVFEQRTPAGVRVPTDGGAHYALYSFAPGLRVINGFIYALVGLYDLGRIGDSARARTLYADGERVARVELPTFDTGAWSLYSRGSIEHESDLSYHRLLRDFLEDLCNRNDDPVYCDTELRLAQYELEPPQLSLVTTRLRGGTDGKLRLRLSKISRVGLRVERGPKVVSVRPAVVVGHGTPTLRWPVPRKAGDYDVRLTAVDLAGNVGTAEGTLEVLKPMKRKPR